MSKDKKSFLLYCDIIETVEELEDDEAGRLLKHILRYVNDLYPNPPDKITKIVFEPIKQQLKRDLKKYEAIKKRNTDNGLKGGRPLNNNPNNPVGYLETQKTQPNPLIDTVTDTDTENNKKEEIVKPLFDSVPESPDPFKIDFQKLGEYFNANMPFSKITLPISKARKISVQARVNEYGKEKVFEMLNLAKESPFMAGENEKCWKASFDWLFKPVNFLKVLEGNYIESEGKKVKSKVEIETERIDKIRKQRELENAERNKNWDEAQKNKVLPPKGLSISRE